MRKRKKQKQEQEEGLDEGFAAVGDDDADLGAGAVPPAPPAVTTVSVPAGPETRHVTPVDIQQKAFRTSFRGYAEREVDTFLDEVTEELARAIADTRSLRDQLQRAEMRVTTPLAAGAEGSLVGQAREEAARIIAEARADAKRVRRDALPTADGVPTAARTGGDNSLATTPTRDFIQREREFLQSMAAMIQSHAEAIREDLRRARGGSDVIDASPTTPAAAEEPADDGSAEAGSVAPQPEVVGSDGAEETTATDGGATALEGEASALAAIAGDAADAGGGVIVDVEADADVTEAEPVAVAEPEAETQAEAGSATIGEPADGRSDDDVASPVPAADAAVVDLTAAAEADSRDEGTQDDLLPWEPEPTRAIDVSELTRQAPERPAAPEPATATTTRLFGSASDAAPAGTPSWGSRPAAAASHPDEEADDEGRSLRELFWGED